MSDPDVETVRRAFDLFAQGGVEVLRELLHPKIKLRARIGEVYMGRDPVVEFLRDWSGAFDDFKIGAERLFDAGDRVVAFIHQGGRGRESGVETDQRDAWVLRLSEGKIIECSMYTDRPAALKSAGLQD